MVKTKTKLESEIEVKKKDFLGADYSQGSFKNIQDAIQDIYDKLNDLNERIV